MRQMSFESVGIIEPGRPARPAAARFRRAFVRPILTRPPIRATRPWSLLQISVQAFSHIINIGLFTGKEPHTKQKKIFPLELRAKTDYHKVGGVAKGSKATVCKTVIQWFESTRRLVLSDVKWGYFSFFVQWIRKKGILRY